MKCVDVVAWMLEADPAALRERDRTPEGRHLRECAQCGAAAAQIVADTEGLAGTIASVAARSLSRGALEHVANAPRSRRGWRRPWTLIPLAAAAATALWLRAPSGPTPNPADPEARAAEPALRVEADRQFIVMRTANPKITVVWFY